MPFTPYGGTTAPYRPKGSAADTRDAKGLTCDKCKASGFATRSDLETHRASAHAGSANEAKSTTADPAP